jgi:hypothetical protein
MMPIPRGKILFMALASILGNAGFAVHVSAQLRGAWTLTQSSLAGRDTTITNGSPQPGLVLFTERHYSLMYVEGSQPRVPFADPVRPTDAEKLTAFDTFVGHSGTYTVVDSTVQMHVIVAKHPSMMGTDMRTSFARFVYRIVGDTLWLTRRSGAGTFTMRLVRA